MVLIAVIAPFLTTMRRMAEWFYPCRFFRRGICEHRGKGLAAFLKAIGFIIPLMDAEHANYYTREAKMGKLGEFFSGTRWGWVKTLVPLVNPKIAGIYGCSSH